MKKDLKISHKDILLSDKNYQKAASAVNLVYIKDNEPGIIRKQKGKKFIYAESEEIISNKKQLNG